MNLHKTMVGALICFLTVVSVNAGADEKYVFPAANQSEEQQKADEYACYQWAVEQSGYDPVEDYETVSSQSDVDGRSDTSESGGTGKAVLGGAAKGAVIAEASDGDASKGATTGATIGLIKGKRKQQAAREQERRAAEERARAEAEARQKLISNFERANTACLEGRGYVVK